MSVNEVLLLAEGNEDSTGLMGGTVRTSPGGPFISLVSYLREGSLAEGV